MIISLDVETTGLTSGFHEITELGAVILDDAFNEISTFSTLMKINKPERYSLEAQSISGITVEELEKHGKGQMAARIEFMDWVYTHMDDEKLTPLGHNYDFDKQFLNVFLGAQYDDLFTYRYRDSQRAAGLLIDAGVINPEKVGLDKLAEYFGMSPQIHRALADAKLCVEVYKRLIQEIQ